MRAACDWLVLGSALSRDDVSAESRDAAKTLEDPPYTSSKSNEKKKVSKMAVSVEQAALGRVANASDEIGVDWL